MRAASIAVVVLLSALAAPGQSQEPAPPPAASSAVEFPVSLDRIRRQLAKAPPSAPGDTLRLDYYIEVYGKAPNLQFLNDADLQLGPVPYGGPTHRDFIEHVTPIEFRSPAANLSNVMLLLDKWLAKRAPKKPDDRPPN